MQLNIQKLRLLSLMLLPWLCSPAWADGQYIDIYPKSAAEIRIVLDAVSAQLEDQAAEPPPPIVMMLHGAEAARFLKSQYPANRDLVDQSARLSAFGLIDVQICETWLRANDHGTDELFPFINPVPFGAAELDRLRQEEAYTEYEVGL